MLKLVAILVVMFVINLFMLFAIYRAKDGAEEAIIQYFIEKSSSIWNKPSDEELIKANKLDDNVKEKIVEKIIYVNDNLPQDLSYPSYKPKNFTEEYKKIRDRMNIDKNAAINEVLSNELNDQVSNNSFLYSLASSFYNRISFEEIYAISQHDSIEQESLIGNLLNEDEEILIDSFLTESSQDDFDVLAFYSYIKDLSALGDEKFYVRTGDSEDDFSHFGRDVVTEKDDKICEGLKIVHGNKIYDYSI